MFRLFVDSSTGVDVYPEYDFDDSEKKIESRHRTRDGSEFVYKWSEYSVIKMSVMYVNSAFKSQVNEWWSNNTNLLWMETGGTDVTSVRLTNTTKPISKVIKPYYDLFQGKIELGTY